MAKKKEETEGKSKFQLALDSLNQKYGIGTILELDSKSNINYDVISSGSIGLDWILLGVGGFVKGKLYELMGWEGSSKTTVAAHTAAECQKKGGKVVYIDAENGIDIKYLKSIGVDTSKMIITSPSNGEEGFNIAMEMITTGEVDLVIIDSDSSLIPKKVIDGEVGDSSIGKKALLNSNAYPKLKSALANNKVCVIVISQYREKIGVMFGNPTTTQGGHALKFYSDCRIEMSKSLAKDGDDIYGNTVKMKCTKNKMSPPYRNIDFEVVYGKGIDKDKELITLLNDFEIIKKWGKTVTYNETKYENFEQVLIDNLEFKEELKQELINKINETPIEEIIQEEI